MKENIEKSILWAVSIMIGLIMTDIIKGTTIDYIMAIVGGLLFGLIEFIVNTILLKRKR